MINEALTGQIVNFNIHFFYSQCTVSNEFDQHFFAGINFIYSKL